MALSKSNLENLAEWDVLTRQITKTIDDLQEEVVNDLATGRVYEAAVAAGQITAYKWILNDALDYCLPEGK